MNAREVLVTGGTGVLGRRVVERFGSAGIEARVLSRSGRSGTVKGDLLTGEGLARAVRGVDTVPRAPSARHAARTSAGPGVSSTRPSGSGSRTSSTFPSLA